jgi:hypothetical protein
VAEKGSFGAEEYSLDRDSMKTRSILKKTRSIVTGVTLDREEDSLDRDRREDWEGSITAALIPCKNLHLQALEMSLQPENTK